MCLCSSVAKYILCNFFCILIQEKGRYVIESTKTVLWSYKLFRPKRTLEYIQNVAKNSHSQAVLTTESEALAWARENARSMVMSLGGKNALTVMLRTLGVEIPTSGLYIPTRQSTLHGVLVHSFRRYSARFPVISA